MKYLITFLVIILTLTAVIYTAAFFTINAKGNEFIVDFFNNSLGIKAELKEFRLVFPFTFEIKGLAVDRFSFDHAKVSVGIIKTILGRPTLDKFYVNGYRATIQFNEKGLVGSNLLTKITNAASGPVSFNFSLVPDVYAAEDKNKFIRINDLRFKNGSLKIIDLRHDKEVAFGLEGVDFSLRDFVYPELKRFEIEARATLRRGDIVMPEAISLRGWVDNSHKNMDVSLSLKNLNYFAFADYFSGNWHPEKIGLSEAILSLDSRLYARDNDLSIDCVFSADKVDFVPAAELEDPTRMRTVKTVLALLKGDNDKPSFPFRLKTKMDSPNFDLVSIKGAFKNEINIPKLAIKSAVDRVAHKVSQKAGQTKEVTKEAAKATVDTLKEVVEDVIDEFKDAYKSYKQKE